MYEYNLQLKHEIIFIFFYVFVQRTTVVKNSIHLIFIIGVLLYFYTLILSTNMITN